MRSSISLIPLSIAFLLVAAGTARAEDQPKPPEEEGRHLFLSLAGTSGYTIFARSETSPTSEAGLTLGGDVRLHPYSMHGVFLGYTAGGAVFGPSVNVIDAGYSLRIAERNPRSHVFPVVYLDAGPAFGFVDPGNQKPIHHVLGGRASVAMDLQIWAFTIGAQLAYRGGLPVDKPSDPWEGALAGGLRVGIAIDDGPRTTSNTVARRPQSLTAAF